MACGHVRRPELGRPSAQVGRAAVVGWPAAVLMEELP